MWQSCDLRRDMLDCFYHYHAEESSLVLRSAAAQQPPAAMSKQQIKSSAKLKSLIQLVELTPMGTTTTSIGIKVSKVLSVKIDSILPIEDFEGSML